MISNENSEIEEAEQLEFEYAKNDKLQYFLFSSVKTNKQKDEIIEELKKELKISKANTNVCMCELNAYKRKYGSSLNKDPWSALSSSSLSSSSDKKKDNDQGEGDEDASPVNHKKKRGSVTKTTTVATSKTMLNSRIDKAINFVADSLCNPSASTPAKNFLSKFVCRIFDGGDLYYGLVVKFNKAHFQVVYSDGDTQQLSFNEVRLSLIEEAQVPVAIVVSCRSHYDNGTYLSRTPLPTIS